MTERDKVLSALETAIAMEIDGKECYLAASKNSKNKAGKPFLQSLAEDEEQHRQRFTEIYDALRKKQQWPKQNPVYKNKRIRDTLHQACILFGDNVSGTSEELAALTVAIDKERQSYSFYEQQSGKADSEVEKSFYKSLAAEERVHELALLDYYEYLTDPAGWFVKKEHTSLDGA